MRLLPVLLSALLLVAVGCGGDDAGDDDAAPVSTTSSTVPDGGEDRPDAFPPDAGLAVGVETVVAADFPVTVAARPGRPEVYLAEQQGAITALRPTSEGWARDAEPFLDLTAEVNDVKPAGEAGLLGITFSPDDTKLYAMAEVADHDPAHVDPEDPEDDGRFWILRLLEFEVDGDTVDPDSRRLMLELEKERPHHNGGEVRFGPDGYLYVSLGDQSVRGCCDDLQTGQDPTDLYGSLLRIDPTPGPDGQPWTVPADNPFADGVDGAPEVWLIGVRNPWRFDFDPLTGDLWIADVGENTWEEVSMLPGTDGLDAGRAANLGWSAMEGPELMRGDAVPVDHHAPIYAYPRDVGCAVIGGAVYRGGPITDLEGHYLFSDWCAETLFSIEPGADPEVTAVAPLEDSVIAVVAVPTEDERLVWVLERERVAQVVPG